MNANVESDRLSRGLKSFVVTGEGLWPRIKDGEVIYVATEASPQPGDEVLVITKEGLLLVREYLDCDESGRFLLRSLEGEAIKTDLADIVSVHVIAGVRQADRGRPRIHGGDGRAFVG